MKMATEGAQFPVLATGARRSTTGHVSQARVNLSLEDVANSGFHLHSSQLGGKTVLPYSKHANSTLLQEPSYFASAFLVVLYFSYPVVLVSCRKPKASCTAMPETPVHKYGEAMSGEPKVGTAKYPGWVQTPAPDSCAYENRPQSVLRGPVAAGSNPRHQDASLLFCQHIHSRTLSLTHEHQKV